MKLWKAPCREIGQLKLSVCSST